MTLLQKPQLGCWDLSELVDGEKNNIKNYLKILHDNVIKFKENRKLLNDNISSQKFSKMLLQLEKISEKLNIVVGFAHLQYSSNTSSNEYSAFVTEMELLGTEISNNLIFFDIWFKNILKENDAHRLIQTVDPVYQQYLTHKRTLGKYTLSEKEEKIVTLTGQELILNSEDIIISAGNNVVDLAGIVIPSISSGSLVLFSLADTPSTFSRLLTFETTAAIVVPALSDSC